MYVQVSSRADCATPALPGNSVYSLKLIVGQQLILFEVSSRTNSASTALTGGGPQSGEVNLHLAVPIQSTVVAQNYPEFFHGSEPSPAAEGPPTIAALRVWKTRRWEVSRLLGSGPRVARRETTFVPTCVLVHQGHR